MHTLEPPAVFVTPVRANNVKHQARMGAKQRPGVQTP